MFNITEEQRASEQQELDAALGRMAKFQEEMVKLIPVAPTHQVKIPELVSEVERLRSRVSEMEMEREEARKKRSRSLSVPDLVGGPNLSLQEWRALHSQHAGQHRGAIMETLISRGSFGSEFQPVQAVGLRDLASVHRCPARRVVAWGARGVRVGEARTQVLTTLWRRHNGRCTLLSGESSTRVDGKTGVRHRERRKCQQRQQSDSFHSIRSCVGS